MPTPTFTHDTGVTKEVTVSHPVEIYARPSNKKEGVLVLGISTNGSSKRVALVRVSDDGESVTIRTLDGNPRERSSTAETQTVLDLRVTDLTDDNLSA